MGTDMEHTLTAKCEQCDREIRGRESNGRMAWDHANYVDRLIGGVHFPYPLAGSVKQS